jgi:hypothetical protein
VKIGISTPVIKEESIMKVRFLEVSGHVGIDDKVNFRKAKTGMLLETSDKKQIIVTGEDSRARLLIGSKTINLDANSFLRLGWHRPRGWEKAKQDIRTVAGRLWAMIDDGEVQDDDSNVAVGVRG